MDHLALVTGLQVPEDGGVVEESQVDHVLTLFKLGWIDSSNFLDAVVELLVGNRNNTLCLEVRVFCTNGGDLWTRLEEALPEPARLRAGNPDRLLWIINLLLVISPRLYIGPEELRGVWIHLTLDQLHMTRHRYWKPRRLVKNIEGKFANKYQFL